MHERIREIRSSLNLNQSDFAKSLGMGSSTLGMMEIGKRNILDRHIKTICSIYNVNEHWLRTGEGDMFIENDSTIIAELAGEYKLDAIDQKIIEYYLKMNEQSRQSLKDHVVSIAQEITSLNETVASTDEIDIDVEVNRYRQELEASKKAQKSSVSEVIDETS